MFPEQQILMLVVPHFVYRDCMFSASFAGRTVLLSLLQVVTAAVAVAWKKDQIINIIIYKREMHVPAQPSNQPFDDEFILGAQRVSERAFFPYSTYIFVYIKKSTLLAIFSMYLLIFG